TVFRDGKRGSADVNGRDADEIEAALAAAMTAADAGIEDPANDVAEAPSLAKSGHGPVDPERGGKLAAAGGFINDLSEKYPKVRTRNTIYSFADAEMAFANSRGVQQAERRGFYQFGAMFSGKDGRQTTSFNYSGVASYEPFARLLAVGSVN